MDAQRFADTIKRKYIFVAGIAYPFRGCIRFSALRCADRAGSALFDAFQGVAQHCVHQAPERSIVVRALSAFVKIGAGGYVSKNESFTYVHVGLPSDAAMVLV
jgi:hypothetical protein